jgi:hypothetical protein
MTFRIDATTQQGAVSVLCSTASEAVDKVLELERRPHGSITVKDGTGRVINLDELTSLCEAGEDSSPK